MANHVYNYLMVYGNDAALAKLAEINSRCDPDQDDASFLHYNRKNMPDPNEHDYNYEWYLNEVGAKWAIWESSDKDSITITSAWGGVIPLATAISKEVAEADPNAYITMSCEDEMPNWFGVYVFHSGQLYDMSEWDYDNLVERAKTDFSQLQTEENVDWSEEQEEFFSDVMYEVMQDMQDADMTDITKALEYEIDQTVNAHCVGC